MYFSKNILLAFCLLFLPYHCYSQGGPVPLVHNQQNPQTGAILASAFLKAAQDGNLSELQRLMYQGTKITVANNEGINALHMASSYDRVECLRFLLKDPLFHEAIESPTKNEGWTPLHVAAHSGTIDCFRALTSAYKVWDIKRLSEVVKSRDKKGRTPLHIAAAHGHLECVKELLRIHRNLQSADEQGMRPVDLAVNNNHPDCAEVLRKAQNDEEFLNAARTGNLPELKRLKEQGIPIDSADYLTGETALHLAAVSGQVDCVQYLLNNGADRNIQKFSGLASPGNYPSRDGYTALHGAAEVGHLICVQRLLCAGADPNIQESAEKETPLYKAIRKGHVACVEALINGKALLEVTNFGPYTPLEWAAKKVIKGGSCDIVRVLLKAGSSLKSSRQILFFMVEDLVDDDEPWNQSVIECMSLLIDSGVDLFEGKLSPEEKPYAPFLRDAVYAGALELLPQLVKNSYRFLGSSKEAIEKSRTRLRIAYFGLTQQFKILGVKEPDYYIYWTFLQDSGFLQDLVTVLIGELCDGGNPSVSPLFTEETRKAAVDYLTKQLIDECANYFETDKFWDQYEISEERKNEIRSFLSPENIRETCAELIQEGINARIDELKRKHRDFRQRMKKRIKLFVDDLVDEGISSLHFLGLPETQKAVAHYIIDNECSNPSLAALREASRNNGLATLVRGLFEVQGIRLNHERLVQGCIDTRVKELQKRNTPQASHSKEVSQPQSATNSTAEPFTKRPRVEE